MIHVCSVCYVMYSVLNLCTVTSVWKIVCIKLTWECNKRKDAVESIILIGDGSMCHTQTRL